MASTQRALAWLLERSGQFELKIHQHDWIEPVLEGWIDLNCSFTFQGKVLNTWGASDNNDIALVKAFAEALERVSMLTSQYQHSNGFAAHTDQESAHENAKRELLERDLFFCHYLTKTPLVPFKLPSNWFWASDAVDWAEQNGLEMSFYHLGSTGLVCRVDGRHHENAFGLIMGLAFKQTHEASALSAFIEAGRATSLQRLMPFPTKSLSISEFWEIEKPQFGHHGRLALDVGYASSISELFGTDPAAVVPQELGFDLLTTEEIKIQHPDLADCPYFFAKASSAKAQELFLGSPKADFLNFERLSNFAGRTITFDDINTLPHPLD